VQSYEVDIINMKDTKLAPSFITLNILLITIAGETLGSILRLGTFDKFTQYYKPSDLALAKAVAINVLYVSIMFVAYKIFTNKNESGAQIVNREASIPEASKIFTNTLIAGCAAILAFMVLGAIRYGAIEYFIEIRTGLRPVGILGYMMLYLYPTLLCTVEISANRKLALVYTSALVIFALLTGFRLHVVWAALTIFAVKLGYIERKNTWRILLAATILFVSLIAYAILRKILGQVDGTSVTPTDLIVSGLFDLLTRSGSVAYTAYIVEEHISFNPIGLVLYSMDQLQLIAQYLNIQREHVSYPIEVFSEKMFRDYLVWRGTPNMEATGFSVSIIPLAYAHGSAVALTIAAVAQALIVRASELLLSSRNLLKKTIGGYLFAFSIALIEDPAVAVGLFAQSIVLLSGLALLAGIIDASLNNRQIKSPNACEINSLSGSSETLN
jgi:hypothetical protein